MKRKICNKTVNLTSRKIELVENDNNWCWVILEYDNEVKRWCNIRSGEEDTAEKAFKAAMEEYNLIK